MQTFQTRRRVVRPAQSGAKLRFPNACTITVTFSPGAPFGGAHTPSRTAPLGSSAQSTWNAVLDRHSMLPSFPLDPVSATISDSRRTITFEGDRCTVACEVASLAELNALLHRLVYHLPAVMNLEFVDAPTIADIRGSVGDTQFVWLYDHRSAAIDVVTREKQEDRLRLSWQRLNQLRGQDWRRVLAAVHWFHVACRLERAGANSWEFASEVLLNLAKILEVLFPARGGTGSIDAAREGLSSIGYASEHIETWFVPALALRNGLDVAHVSLAELDADELDVLHNYSEQAECHFRELLLRVLEAVEQGTYSLPPRAAAANSDGRKVISRMAAAVAKARSSAETV